MSLSKNKQADEFDSKLNYLSIWLGFVFCCSALTLLLFLFFDMRELINPACAEQLRIRNDLYLFSKVVPDVLLAFGLGFLLFPVVVFLDRRKKQKKARCQITVTESSMNKLMLSVIAASLSFSVAHASLNDDMNKFFGKLGYEQNTTTPKVWQGQAAGYATGGALYARTSAKDVQLVSLQLPSLNAGCGGIDMFLGSFSFISKDEFIQFAKSILSNAPGLFFDLALKTVTPQLASAKDFLQKLASDVNGSNMSSCQAARAIVGGLWPETQENASAVCQTIGSDSNFFSDWAAARQAAAPGGSTKI